MLIWLMFVGLVVLWLLEKKRTGAGWVVGAVILSVVGLALYLGV